MSFTPLPVVLNGCETWSLTSKEENKLKVFENRVPRRIFGPKRDEVVGGWRKLHNEQLHSLYCLPNMMINSRRMSWTWHAAHMGEQGNAYRIFVRKLKGKEPLGRPRSRREDNIKIDLKEISWCGMDTELIWLSTETNGGLL
jgi:hypothetical protein